MDEKVLKLFAEVGPNAKEALESYIHLQWAEFFVNKTFMVFGIIAAIFLIYEFCKVPKEKDEN